MVFKNRRMTQLLACAKVPNVAEIAMITILIAHLGEVTEGASVDVVEVKDGTGGMNAVDSEIAIGVLRPERGTVGREVPAVLVDTAVGET
jgi:hypothetical protein